MVRLKDRSKLRLSVPEGYFNSTMVRLKAWNKNVLDFAYMYFNSTMVRLKENENQQLTLF